MLFNYIQGGSYREETLAANRADFCAVTLRQRVLRDVSTLSTRQKIIGREYSLPVALAPVGMGGMYARRGEVQAARAADAAGIPLILSTVSVCSIEEVAAASGRPIWFQLYMIKDRSYMEVLLARAHQAGVETLVLTVDLAVTGTRYRDVRTGLTGQRSAAQWLRIVAATAMRPGWLYNVYLRGRPLVFGNLVEAIPDARAGSDFYSWIGRNFDPSVTWRDIEWVRQRWPGTIVLKGILDPDDAEEAVAAGTDGIVVSNHGGRQLDGASSTIAALPAIVDRIAGRTSILLDGGVRSGLDVLRALALGAQACLVGRPWAYAVACGGRRGVEQMLAILGNELEVAMALTGCTDVAQAGPDLVFRRPDWVER